MIVRSRSADVTVPHVSITEYVLRHAERLGDKPAVIDGPSGRILTYRQLEEAVRRAATGLSRRGLRKGADRRAGEGTAATDDGVDAPRGRCCGFLASHRQRAAALDVRATPRWPCVVESHLNWGRHR